MRFDLETSKFAKAEVPSRSKSKQLSAAKPNPAASLSSRKQDKIGPTGQAEYQPLLYVDVNLKSGQERIIVHEGDTAPQLAQHFAETHGSLRINYDIGLDVGMQSRLEALLNMQIEQMLSQPLPPGQTAGA